MTVGVLLLAAGSGVRFGSDKRLAVLPAGRTVFETTLSTILESGLPCRVCLAPGDDSVADICRAHEVTFISCQNASRGMGETLAEGMQHIPNWRAVLVALADMPFVQATTYQQLASRVTEEIICRPESGGRQGHPVAFGALYYKALANMAGDVGARGLLTRHAGKVQNLDCHDEGVLTDINCPDDIPRRQRR